MQTQTKPTHGAQLQHNRTGRKFTYIGETIRQFTNHLCVCLLNKETGKEEFYAAETYLQYFTIIQPEK